ncbi:hypothetical protein [Thermocrinis minervae]|uniref:Uncharacterized protein n=1 Tax=Thermocrinis minervae TaxID=381751 RepID=A0A1M6Q988_9AQUI|nr:hypothetical protein [Thermocrinis minervae]SHK16854.1 hypothetical protein SAMN05444391_0137 [Thermocrinis minervae]
MLYARKSKKIDVRSLEKEPQRVFISPFEILAVLVVVAFLLVLMFPKKDLEQYLKTAPEVNVDLTLAYLEALARTTPNVKERAYIEGLIVEKLVSLGKYEIAVKRIEALEKAGIGDWDLILLRYKLTKQLYFAGRATKDQVDNFLEKLLSLADDDVQKLKLVFSESIAMDVPKVAYKSSYKLYKLTKDIQYAKVALDYALYYRDKKVIEELSPFKVQLEKQALKDLLASFQAEKDKTKRKDLFVQIIRVYLANQDYENLEKFIDAHWAEFKGQKDVEMIVIRSLLMAGKPQKAGQIVKSIFQGEDR